MESIGQVLRQERESKGLSLDDVYDATRITLANLSAIEDDRFDAFPNRVYARAFLRDYANYLGMNSADLLMKYESGWNVVQETVPVATPKKSIWRPLGYGLALLLILAILAIIAVVKPELGSKVHLPKLEKQAKTVEKPNDVAELPKTKPIAPDRAEEETIKTMKPAQPAKAPEVSDKLMLTVAATDSVWVRVKADGYKVYEGIMPVGAVKGFEAKKSINIRAGKAGAIQMKLNGMPQPSLGPLGAPGEKTFGLPRSPAGNDPAKPASP